MREPPHAMQSGAGECRRRGKLPGRARTPSGLAGRAAVPTGSPSEKMCMKMWMKIEQKWPEIARNR
eukprot:738308-Prymnesium_polylepis.1